MSLPVPRKNRAAANLIKIVCSRNGERFASFLALPVSRLHPTRILLLEYNFLIYFSMFSRNCGVQSVVGDLRQLWWLDRWKSSRRFSCSWKAETRIFLVRSENNLHGSMQQIWQDSSECSQLLDGHHATAICRAALA